MSTKNTILSGEAFHVYHEMNEETNGHPDVYIEVEAGNACGFYIHKDYLFIETKAEGLPNKMRFLYSDTCSFLYTSLHGLEIAFKGDSNSAKRLVNKDFLPVKKAS